MINTSPGVLVSCPVDEQMAVFDGLPKCVRLALARSDIKFDARVVANALREGRNPIATACEIDLISERYSAAAHRRLVRGF